VITVRRWPKYPLLVAARCLRPVLLLWLLLSSAAAAATQIAGMNLDAETLTVSGVSSGGYMAQQFHVAHSQQVAGAAIVAAGPYRCAGDDYPWNMTRTLYRCMRTGESWLFLGPPDPQESIAATHEAFADGEIDAPDGLAGDRVFLFSGGGDNTVPGSVVAALRDYYLAFVATADLRFVDHPTAGHAWPTADYGNSDCAVTAPPYLNDCDYDLAGARPSLRAGRLCGRYGLSASCRLPRLPPARGAHRRRLLCTCRLQPLGGGERHRRALPADPCPGPAVAEPERLLGLVGLQR